VLRLAVPVPQGFERLSAHCQYTQLDYIRSIRDKMQKSFEVSDEKMLTANGLAKAMRNSRHALGSPSRDLPTPLISADLPVGDRRNTVYYSDNTAPITRP
jgi:hypothetical protein